MLVGRAVIWQQCWEKEKTFLVEKVLLKYVYNREKE